MGSQPSQTPSQTPSPGRRRLSPRLWRIGVIIFVGVLVVAALISARLDLLRLAVIETAKGTDYPIEAVTVESLTLDRAVFTAIDMGPLGTARFVEVTFSVSSLLVGMVDTVTIRDIRLDATQLARAGAPTKTIDALPRDPLPRDTTARAEDQSARDLHSLLASIPVEESLDVQDLRLDLAPTPADPDRPPTFFVAGNAGLSIIRAPGPVRSRLVLDLVLEHETIRGHVSGTADIPFGNRIETEFRILNADVDSAIARIGDFQGQVSAAFDLPPRPNRRAGPGAAMHLERFDAAVSLHDVEVLGLPSETGTIRVSGGHRRLDAAVSLYSEAINGAASIAFGIDDPVTAPRLRVDAEARTDGAALVRRFSESDAPITGRIVSFASLETRLPPMPDWLTSSWDPGVIAALRPSGFVDLGIEALTIPERFQNLDLSGSLDLQVQDETVLITAASPITATAQSVDSAFYTALRLPKPIADSLTAGIGGPLSVSIDGASPEEPLSLAIVDREGGQISGQMGATLTAGSSDLRIAAYGSVSQGVATTPPRLVLSDLIVASRQFFPILPGVEEVSFSINGRFSGDPRTAEGGLSVETTVGRVAFPGIEADSIRIAGPLSVRLRDSVLRVAAPDLLSLAAAELSLGDARLTGVAAVAPMEVEVDLGEPSEFQRLGGIAPLSMALAGTAEIGIEGASGPAGIRSTGPLSFRLTPTPDTARWAGMVPQSFELVSQFPIRLQADILDGHDLALDAVRLRAAPLQDQHVRLDLQAKAARLIGFGITANDLSARVELFGGTNPGEATPTLRSLSAGVGTVIAAGGFPVMAGRLDVRPGAPGINEIAGDVSVPGTEVTVRVSGSADANWTRGSVEAVASPLVFSDGALQPAALFPPLKGMIESADGTIRLRSQASWGPQGFTTSARVAAEDLDLIVGGIEARRINAAIVIDDLLAMTTPPGQIASAAALDIGLPVRDLLVRFQLTRPSGADKPPLVLRVQSVDLNLASGTVTAAPVAFNLDQPDGQLVLTVDKASVEDLLSLAQLEGIAASGTLSGRVPIAIRGDRFSISDGRLISDGPGELRYAPSEPPAVLRGADTGVSLLLQALANFRYKSLAIDLAGSVGGPEQQGGDANDAGSVELSQDRGGADETQIKMRIEGANPDFYDGYPVVFNLNISGDLGKIVTQSLRGYQTPDVVRRRLLEIMQ